MHLLLCQGGQWSYIRVVSGLYQPLSSGRRVGLVRWGKVNSMEQYEVPASVTILAGFPTELYIIIIISSITIIKIIMVLGTNPNGQNSNHSHHASVSYTHLTLPTIYSV